MIKADTLQKGYSKYGNKGAVWSNTIHIQKDGSPTTLCELPMLSTNHACYGIEGYDTSNIGCDKCINAYVDMELKKIK